MRARSLGLALACLVGASASERAALAEGLAPDLREPDPPVATTPVSTPPSRWYGGEVLLVDLASDLTILGGGLLIANANGDGGGGAVLPVFGFVGYVLGGPIVHAAHRSSGGVIAGSLALRLALPVVGFFVGLGAASSCASPPPSMTSDSFDLSGLDCLGAELDGAIIGFGVGMLTAQILDAALLSDEPVHARAAAASTGEPWHLVVQPTLGALRDSEGRRAPTLGVVVTF